MILRKKQRHGIINTYDPITLLSFLIFSISELFSPLISLPDIHLRTEVQSLMPLNGFRSRYLHVRKEFKDPLLYKQFH